MEEDSRRPSPFTPPPSFGNNNDNNNHESSSIILQVDDSNNNNGGDYHNDAYDDSNNNNNNTQNSELIPTQMTQNELTQLGDFDDDAMSPNSTSGMLAPPSPINLRNVPWGRLIPQSLPTDNSNNQNNGNNNNNNNIGIDLLPRDPKVTNGSNVNNGVSSSCNSFLGLTGLKSSHIFNEYILGRSGKCDVVATKPTAATATSSASNNENRQKEDKIKAMHNWVHGMISNNHCRIYCMLKPSSTSSGASPQDMDVYIEDTSGNGTLINNTILLKRGEKRLLHTGDEICFINDKLIKRRVRSLELQQELKRHHSFIFINVFKNNNIQQQQQQQQQQFLLASSSTSNSMLSSSLSNSNHNMTTRSASKVHTNDNNSLSNRAIGFSGILDSGNITSSSAGAAIVTGTAASNTNTSMLRTPPPDITPLNNILASPLMMPPPASLTSSAKKRRAGLVDVRSTRTPNSPTRRCDATPTINQVLVTSSNSGNKHDPMTLLSSKASPLPAPPILTTSTTTTPPTTNKQHRKHHEQVKQQQQQQIARRNKKQKQKQQRSSSQQQQKLQKEKRRIEEYYDIRDVLGTGTCGEVKRAIHRRSGQEYAVKVINFGGGRNRISMGGKNGNNNANISSFLAEASMLQSLDHPYIVKLIDVFISSNQKAIYIVMELLTGGDLFDRIVSKSKYTETESRRIMRRMLAAIYYLHEDRGIVHRDLKPENILCTSHHNDIDIKLTDFGLAKSVTEDGLKTFCGTPAYFAPEVLRRRHTVAGRGRYGKQADMWSLGVILYVLLSGSPPFDANNNYTAADDDYDDDDDEYDNSSIHRHKTKKKKSNSSVGFPSDLFYGISTDAKHLVSQLLLTDPKKRLSVKDACNHRWILIHDGDTHTHPLNDPIIQQHLFEKQQQQQQGSNVGTTTSIHNSNNIGNASEIQEHKQQPSKEECTNKQLFPSFRKSGGFSSSGDDETATTITTTTTSSNTATRSEDSSATTKTSTKSSGNKSQSSIFLPTLPSSTTAKSSSSTTKERTGKKNGGKPNKASQDNTVPTPNNKKQNVSPADISSSSSPPPSSSSVPTRQLEDFRKMVVEEATPKTKITSARTNQQEGEVQHILRRDSEKENSSPEIESTSSIVTTNNNNGTFDESNGICREFSEGEEANDDPNSPQITTFSTFRKNNAHSSRFPGCDRRRITPHDDAAAAGELSDDEICSEFSDEDENDTIDSFGATTDGSTTVIETNNETDSNDGDCCLERISSTSSSSISGNEDGTTADRRNDGQKRPINTKNDSAENKKKRRKVQQNSNRLSLEATSRAFVEDSPTSSFSFLSSSMDDNRNNIVKKSATVITSNKSRKSGINTKPKSSRTIRKTTANHHNSNHKKERKSREKNATLAPPAATGKQTTLSNWFKNSDNK